MVDEPGTGRPFRKPPPGWGSRPPQPPPTPTADDARPPTRNPALTAAVIGRGIALSFLTYLTWRTIAGGLDAPRPGGILTFIDGANFIFHEAGHVIFIFFGEFLAVLGGSLNQVLIPAIVTGYFFWHRQPCATLFWTGQSITGVAVYAADAQAMRLPLHGGEGSAVHDWHRLLLWTTGSVFTRDDEQTALRIVQRAFDSPGRVSSPAPPTGLVTRIRIGVRLIVDQ